MCPRQKNDNGTNKSHFDLWYYTKDLYRIGNGEDSSTTTPIPLNFLPRASDVSRGSDSKLQMSSIPQSNSPSKRKRKFKCDKSSVVKLLFGTSVVTPQSTTKTNGYGFGSNDISTMPTMGVYINVWCATLPISIVHFDKKSCKR